MRPAWTFFIAQFIRLVESLPASARALKIGSQQLRDNSVVRANAFGPLAFHVDHELRGLVVRCGPMALLGTGGVHKDYDARYDAQQAQNWVTHCPSSI